jgi:phosphomevalonate kinase
MDFVEQIYSHCEKAGMIRELEEESNQALDERLNRLLDEGQVDKVIELMVQFFESKDEEELIDDVRLLSSRYKRLQRKITREIINEEDANVESNKIHSALMEINKEVTSLLSA